MKLQDVLNQSHTTGRLSEGSAPTGLGVFDYHEEDNTDVDPVKFKKFVAKAEATLSELEDYRSDVVQFMRVKSIHDPETKKLISNVIASKDEYEEFKTKQDPYNMEMALSDIKRRYNELKRHIDLNELSESVVVSEAVKFKDCAAMLKSFMANMRRVREDLENTKGTDDIDDALDYFDSVMKQFENAQVGK